MGSFPFRDDDTFIMFQNGDGFKRNRDVSCVLRASLSGVRDVCLRLSPIAVDKFVVKMAEAASGAGRMGDACFCGSVFSGGVLFTEKKAAVIFVWEVKPAGIAVRTM